jgi:hypothetical protein
MILESDGVMGRNPGCDEMGEGEHLSEDGTVG